MPALSNFGSVRSMTLVPLIVMTTWSPLAVMTKSFQSPFLIELGGLLLGVALEDAAAAFLVEQAPVAVGDVGLRAGDAAVAARLLTELDARVAVLELDLGLEDEVAVGLVGDEELVLLELAVGPADDLAVLDGEEALVVGGL